jgi:hypothetical protein
MTYKDMTFCSGDGCVKFNKCFRALTPDVETRAAKIGLPISQFSNPKEVECYEAPKSNDLRRQSDQASAA